MARIFITGSADGLGQLSARSLVEQGHDVVLHARNTDRARDAKRNVPDAKSVVVGDLSDLDAIQHVAHEANALGPFNAVIHNAGVYQAPPRDLWTVNVLAPYVLTSLMHRPRRLIYLSSGMHLGGRAVLERGKASLDRLSYSDSKLYVLMLCLAVARRWPEVYANTVDPGWVPTKMGGSGAPDDLELGHETQTWLAVSDASGTTVSGRYFHHRQERPFNPQAGDVTRQEQLLGLCEQLTGIVLPNEAPLGSRTGNG